jgi:hypothetical protein
MPVKYKTFPPLSRFKQYLRYEPTTGAFFWTVSPNRSVKAGDRAGRLSARGYRDICLWGEMYAAHRLAWLFVHKRLPLQQIDHRNGERDDNRIENLRLADPHTQAQNQKRRSNNSSGFKGVAWRKRSQRWQATIKLPTRLLCLGLFDTAEEAHAAYVAAAREHFGEFARAA